MEPPKCTRELFNGKACLLKSSIYGIHDAPMLLFDRLKEELNKKGFKELKMCSCMFVYNNLVVLVYVDDINLMVHSME